MPIGKKRVVGLIRPERRNGANGEAPGLADRLENARGFDAPAGSFVGFVRFGIGGEHLTERLHIEDLTFVNEGGFTVFLFIFDALGGEGSSQGKEEE